VRFQCIVVTPGSLRVFTIPIVMLTTVSRLRVLLRSGAAGRSCYHCADFLPALRRNRMPKLARGREKLQPVAHAVPHGRSYV
jgi:hypothetical protein